MDLAHTAPADALRAAVSILGSQSALGAAVGRSQSSVAEWIRRGRVPAEIAVRIVAATGGRVPAEALRPDLYATARPPSQAA